MAFHTGLSGLNAAAQNLDIIGNNVANASTVGFKESRAIFSDVFANSLSGAGAGVGLGTKVSSVEQQFTQGNITTTNNPLDLAINGDGFFRMSENGAIFYSRNGEFHLDAEGFIVNSDNLKVTGYGTDLAGAVVQSAPSPIQISTAQVPPSSTTAFRANINFDSRETQPTTAVFDPADPTSYNSSTSGTVFDSLGNPHVMSLYFVKTAVAGQWAQHATVDGTAAANVNLGAGAGVPVNITFDNSGTLTSAMPITPVTLAVGGGAASPLSLSIDLNGSTQYGSEYAVNSLFQDGYTSGRLAGFSIGTDGTVIGRYTNGETKDLGQVVVSTFANPQGLTPLGNNRWEETSDSGIPVTGVPGTGGLGQIRSAAVEESNVDLTAQLVNMITAQRNYQANAQTIKTQDAVLQTLVNLR